MTQDQVEYRVSGLTKFDVLDLKANTSFRIEEDAVPEGTHGELTLITASVVASGIAALAAFLLKRHNGEDFYEEVEERSPDGSTKRRVVRYKKDSSEAPEASVIKQIRGQL